MDANVGDLVVCVDDKPCRHGTGKLLIRGEIYRVERIYRVASLVGYGLPGIADGGSGWDDSRFRKIDHDKTEACETEFVTLLKRYSVTA